MIYLIALIAIVVYIVVCIIAPTKDCRRCNGGGLKNTKRLKFCRKCHGSGRQPRLLAPTINRGLTSGVRYIKESRGSK